MRQEDIRYVYEIDSILDLDEILECLFDELNVDFARLEYFSLSKDDLISEEMDKDKLIDKAIDVSNNEEFPLVVFPGVEVVVVDDSEVSILSKVKLKLNGIDVDNFVEK